MTYELPDSSKYGQSVLGKKSTYGACALKPEPPVSRQPGREKRLEQLRDETEADSMAEVVRKAPALNELVSHERHRGLAFVIKSDDGSGRHVEFI